MTSAGSAVTPIRRQYLEIKKRYPHALVFFRLGDFYETFDDDARVVSRELEIALTSKPMGKNLRVPLAGFPYHSLDTHLSRLLGRGYKVAVCEQTEDPKAAKGLVAREVVRLVTPGTVSDGPLLAAAANNYLVALASGQGSGWGLAYADVTTGEYAACELEESELVAELARLRPAEVLIAEGVARPAESLLYTPLPVQEFDGELAARAITEHFGILSLAGFGCADLPLAATAAGVLLTYIRENQKGALGLVQPLHVYSLDSSLALDSSALRNLDVLNRHDGGPTLVSVLDRTRTKMGGRTLRAWLTRPLLDVAAIERRLDRVQALHDDAALRSALQDHLRRLPDIERAAIRCTAGSAGPRELGALRDGLPLLPAIHRLLAPDVSLVELASELQTHDELAAVLAAGLADEVPPALEQGNVIRAGFSADLDNLREVARDARRLLGELETEAKGESGIRSLKLGYNRVFGYYLEVSTANAALVPESWQRRQTLTGGERYITPALKELEERILSAGERIEALERDLFRGLQATVAAHAPALLATARTLAELDVHAALAEVALERNYCRPLVDDSRGLEIHEGRHPVVEAALDERFVGNDLALDCDEQQIMVLTGPNMAGKSTYLRQAALIVIMAQAGSFVPATSARIGVVDRVHARVGTQDDLAAGQSTFMVEMVETAAILNQATARSLLVFDEIGRGTSTYDGISVARAVVEHLHGHAGRPRTLFATHYHELTELAGALPRVRNYHVAVSEDGDDVVFLHRILPGRADRSYGIHVARLAGLPDSLLRRARDILAELEDGRRRNGQNGHAAQLPLLAEPPALLAELAATDIDQLSPLEALLRLNQLRERARAAVED
ncbi:MAG: DNA mismatch repair protein MutS [Dehalococcoidia bacterium]